MEPIVGTTVEELGAALTITEDSLKQGEFAKIQLCTTALPTNEELELVGIDMALAGFHASVPETKIIDGIPTVSFVVKKGSPVLLALIPIIVPVLTIGLITFGIFKLETITKALLPILLVVGGVVIVTVGLLARPAERVAVRLLEKKTALPEQAYVASTVPNNKKSGSTEKNPDEQLSMLPQTELQDEVKELWRKACEWEGVPPDSKFVVFSEDNPHMPAYHEAMTKLLRFKQVQSGQWQPSATGEERLAARPFEKHYAATSGKFFITQVNPDQVKVTRSDRRGEFFIETAIYGQLPEGPQPTEPQSMENMLHDLVDLTKEEVKRVLSGIPEVVEDSDPRADHLWKLWEDLEAESSPQTIPKSAIPEPNSYRYRADLRNIPTDQMLEAYHKLKKGEPTGQDLMEKNRAWAFSAIREILWERGQLPKENESQRQLLTKTKLPPEWTFPEGEAEPILEVTAGMLPPTQTEKVEKGWKDFYKGNRVQAVIDSTNWRIKARNVTEEAQMRLHESLKTDWKDLVEYQNLQAFGFASGLLTKDEAEQLYLIYGGEVPSPEKWNQLTLAEKVAGTQFAEELIQQRLKKGKASLQTSPKEPFVKVGEGIRYIGKSRGRYENWPKDKWLEYGVTGVVKEYHAEQPAVRVKGEYFEALPPYAVVRWEFGGESVIDPEDENVRWQRLGREPVKLSPDSPEGKRLLDPNLFPQRTNALNKLGTYTILEVHDDGDLTVQSYDKKYVVTTDGQVFAHYTPEEALEKITGEEETPSKEYLAAMMELSEWFAENMRHMELEEMGPITEKYFKTQEDIDAFCRYLESPAGTVRFKEELHDAMKRRGRDIPPKEEWLPSAVKLLASFQPAIREGSKILPFAGFKDDELVWSGTFPDKTLTVVVKDFYSTPRTVIEHAFRNSRAILLNIVTDRPLLLSATSKGEIWWYGTIDNAPVEVHVTGVETFSELELSDIFNGSVATITAVEKQPVKVGDKVMSRAWPGIGGYPWLTVKGIYDTTWQGKPLREFEVTDGLTTNRVFEDSIIAHETSASQPAVIPTQPQPRQKKEDDLEYIADSPEYLAQTIDMTGWRQKIDQTFQEAVERVKNEG